MSNARHSIGAQSHFTSGIRRAMMPLICIYMIAMAQGTTAARLPQSASGVEDATLAPIENNSIHLVAGVQFDETLLPDAQPKDDWYWIPSWFAGTWQRETVTTTKIYNYGAATEKVMTVQETARSLDEEGWQRDDKGEHWNCYHTPFRSESEGERTKQIFIVQSMTPLEITSDKVVKRFEGTGFIVDKETGIILHSARAKSVQTYRLVINGVINSSSVTIEFDKAGKPITAIKTTSEYTQISGFRARDFHEGKDMKSSFSEYLSNHGLHNLHPLRTTELPELRPTKRG